jgi:hypothetical protein
MNSPSSPSVAWRHVATVEIFASAFHSPTLIGDHARGFKLQPASNSPLGCMRLDLFIDAAMDAQRAAFTAGSLLVAMKQAEAAGRLEGFRIVTGQHWIDVSANLQACVGADLSDSLAGSSQV